MLDEHLQTIIAEQPYPLLAMTLSGAHLYGFPSPDSDYDLRGVSILPAHDTLTLNFSTLKRVEKGCTSYRL